MKTGLLFLSMNSWLIANDTYLLLMRPDNSIRLICNHCTFNSPDELIIHFFPPRAQEYKTKARVFRRLTEGTNLRSTGTVYVSLLLHQMIKKNFRASYQELCGHFTSNPLVNFYSVWTGFELANLLNISPFCLIPWSQVLTPFKQTWDQESMRWNSVLSDLKRAMPPNLRSPK